MRRTELSKESGPRSSNAFWSLTGVTAGMILLSVWMRLPSCGESFWLDELHSAWVVWDGPSQIADRARIGNQTPAYFWGLWGWRQLVGDSEWALRASSVIAVALSIAIVCRHFGRVGSGIFGAVVAGAVLTMERQSLFYGTELRPYAWLLPLSGWMVTASINPFHSVRRRVVVWTWTGIVAMHLQPTALLVWSAAAVVIFAGDRRVVWFDRTVVACLIAFGLSACRVIASLATSTWELRERWSVFARPNELADLWRMWPTLWLGLLPAVAIAAIWLRSRKADVHASRSGDITPNRWTTPVRLAAAWLATAAVITMAVFGLAWTQRLSLWHPRYLLALLPIMAVVAGTAVDGLGGNERGGGGNGRVRLAIQITLALAMVGGMLWEQQTYIPLMNGRRTMVVRGEDWRSAAAALRQATQPPAVPVALDEAVSVPSIFLDAGLVETAHYRQRYLEAGQPLPELISDYLTFPFRGPYRVENAEVTPMIERGFQGDSADGLNASGHLLVYRMPAERLTIRSLRGRPDAAAKVGFGGVTVIAVPGVGRENVVSGDAPPPR